MGTIEIFHKNMLFLFIGIFVLKCHNKMLPPKRQVFIISLVYLKGSISLHVDAQLMQYLLFLLSHPISSILILSRSAIFQQILIQIGRDRSSVVYLSFSTS